MEEKGRFMPGQAYVALSRLKNLNGLYLLGFDASAIRVNPAVRTEVNRLRRHATHSTQIPRTIPSAETSMSVRFLNIRSYKEHQEDLANDKTIDEVDVYCFVETFLKDTDQVSPILRDSTTFRMDRPTSAGHGGGVMITARTDILPQELALPANGLELAAVSVTKCSTKIDIVTIYRRPHLNIATFTSRLQTLKNSLSTDNVNIILGDFNINILDSSNHGILTIMEHCGFTQQVKVPTTDYGTLLDHVYINKTGLAEIHVIDTYFSDHDTISISLNL